MESLLERISDLREAGEIEMALEKVEQLHSAYPDDFIAQLNYVSFYVTSYLDGLKKNTHLAQKVHEVFEQFSLSSEAEDLSYLTSISLNEVSDPQLRLKREHLSSFYGLKGRFLCRVFFDRDRAIESFKLSLKLNCNSIDTLFCYASYLDIDCGEAEESMNLYSQLLQINKNHVSALNNFSALMVEKARATSSNSSANEMFDQSKILLQRAEAIQPGFPAYNLACIAALQFSRNPIGEYEQECKHWLFQASKDGCIDSYLEILQQDSDFDEIRQMDWYSSLLDEIRSKADINNDDETETQGVLYAVDFLNIKLFINEPPQRYVPRDNETSCTTGGTVWNASFVTLRFIEDNVNKGTWNRGWWQGASVLELSAGLGLLGVAAASLGALITLTDIGTAQLKLLEKNIELNHCTGAVATELFWGNQLQAEQVATSRGPFKLVIASDLLYIGFRDDVCEALLNTLVYFVSCSQIVILAFEERLPRKEAAFLQDLKMAGISVLEHPIGSDYDSDIRNEENIDGMFAGLDMHDAPTIRIYQLSR